MDERRNREIEDAEKGGKCRRHRDELRVLQDDVIRVGETTRWFELVVRELRGENGHRGDEFVPGDGSDAGGQSSRITETECQSPG